MSGPIRVSRMPGYRWAILENDVVLATTDSEKHAQRLAAALAAPGEAGERCIIHESHPHGNHICEDCTQALAETGKIRIDTSDPDTANVWETAQRAKTEVANWPAWKRGATAPAPTGDALSKFIASQRDLDPDEKRALWANRWELYGSEPAGEQRWPWDPLCNKCTASICVPDYRCDEHAPHPDPQPAEAAPGDQLCFGCQRPINISPHQGYCSDCEAAPRVLSWDCERCGQPVVRECTSCRHRPIGAPEPAPTDTGEELRLLLLENEQLRARVSQLDPIRSAADRFWASVERGECCWEWRGAQARRGYGQFSLNGKGMRAHRAAWILEHGEIPDGYWVCHKCDNPTCVRPDHLFLGSPHDNNQDMIAKGRHVAPFRGKTHCKSGHPLSGENLYVTQVGQRRCRICQARYRKFSKQRLAQLDALRAGKK